MTLKKPWLIACFIPLILFLPLSCSDSELPNVHGDSAKGAAEPDKQDDTEAMTPAEGPLVPEEPENLETSAGDSEYIDLNENYWVTEGRLRVRTSPDLEGRVIGHLESFERVRGIRRKSAATLIDGFESYWYEVETQGGVTGWVYGGYLTSDFRALVSGHFFKLDGKDGSIAEEKLYSNFPLLDLTFRISDNNHNSLFSIFREYDSGVYTVYQGRAEAGGEFVLDRFRFFINQVEGCLDLGIQAAPDSREYRFEILIVDEIENIISDNEFIFDESGVSDYLNSFKSSKKVSLKEVLKKNQAVLDQVTPYDGFDAIYYSVLNSNLYNLKNLLTYREPKQLYNNTNLLILAVEKDGYEIIELLLEAGLSLNSWGSYYGEDTPLKTAIVRDDPRMVEFLLEHGADPDFGEGISPYHLALKSGNERIITLLREYGVDERAFE